DAVLVAGGVEVVALIKEFGFFAQYPEAVGEAARYEDLAAVVRGKLHRDPAAKMGRPDADIDRHIQNGATDHTAQFGLRIFELVMQPAHGVLLRKRVVVLYEGSAQ